MRKLSLSLLGLATIALLTFTTTGCKKDKEEEKTTTKPNDREASSEADQVIDNVNDFINNKSGGGSNQKVSAYSLPCGVVSVDSTEIGSTGKYTYSMHYGNQNSCGYNNYKKKSGTVKWALNSSSSTFDEVGAVFTITFIDYVVENTITGNKVEIDGSVVVTNTTGGYVWEIITASHTPITHKVRGTFTVTYSDGKTRDRSYFQKRTWASTGGWTGLSLTIAADSIPTTGSDILETGKTYEGNYDYKVELSTDMKWSNCGSTWAGPYVLKQGNARFNVTIPFVSPTYIDVEAGYYYDLTSGTLVQNCQTNAYKITTVIGPATTTTYQLY